MFLEPLPKCSGCLPYVFLIAFQHVTFVSVNYTTFFGDMIFIFGCHKFIFDGFSTFKVNFYAIFLHKFLKVSLSPSLYGTVIEPLHVGLLFWLLFLLFLGALIFVFILLMAHIGYLHGTKASWICFCSSSNNSWMEHMSLALCSNELITLYLLDMAWWLSHLRYWLV